MLRLCLGILGAVPFLVALLAALDVVPSIVFAFDRVFDAHCHRDPSRTLVALGQRLPVCARCTGLYAGVLFAALLPRPRLCARYLLAATGAAAFAMLVDVGTEAFGLRVPSLTARLVTGFGFAYAATATALARGVHRPHDGRLRELQDETAEPGA